MTQKILVGAITAVLVLAIAAYIFRDSLPLLSDMGEERMRTARFTCDLDKTIDASFYDGKVILDLSDGRKLTLPQLASASGVRYGNEDESFVFWNEGNTAFVSEGPQGDQTYTNCEVLAEGQEARSTYASSTMGVTFKYPKSYTLGVGYQYTGFPKKPINGIKVLIPESMATGTNLSNADTGVSIEQLPRAINCTGDIYVVANVKASNVSENGITYSLATSSDAGAGNLYEEMVYAIPGSSPCTAIRYLIHSMNIGNYAPGAVREFDRASLLAEFDAIRASLVLTATSTSSQAP